MDQTYDQMVRSNWLGGRAAGRAEGLAEGQAKLLGRQLKEKFGAVPKPLQQRLAQASPKELDVWGVRLLGADTPEAVFGN